jgi:hypothetical protein
MVYRRYGANYQSVDVDFDAKGISYFGFRRNRERTIPVEGFEDHYAFVERFELTAEAEGSVQVSTKQELLDRVYAQLQDLVAKLPDGGLLIVENKSGHDYPKTLQDMKNVIVEGENRLHFAYTMKSALRVAVYRPVD